MGVNIFVAGATGAIGRSLIPLLLEAGHTVTGATRTSAGKATLEKMGIRAIVVDVFDRTALEQAVAAARTQIVMHQLTDLPAVADPVSMEAALARNARLRRVGTANLVHAARAAGVGRIIAQSIAWAYAPKTPPYREDDPLDIQATGARAVSVGQGVVPLENAILGQDEFEGIVLRYGQLYGPGTWSALPNGTSPVHVDAAAYAALLAIDHGNPGAYNIAEPGGAVSIDRALAELGWHPGFRLPVHG